MRDDKKNSSINYSDVVKTTSLPFVNDATVSELLTAIITPSLQERKERWMEEIGKEIRRLETSSKLKIEDLSSDEQFIDTVLQATNLALKTSDKEKIAIFRNVILNTALGETPEQTLTHIFLNLIDGFTVWHIKILQLFNNPPEVFKKNNKPIPNHFMGTLSNIAIDMFPELKGKAELLSLIWNDLRNAGLHNTSDFGTTMTGNGLLAERTTNLGKMFLTFISNHTG
ncbi:MAG: hypothetical protein JWQ25_2165 [Daejeonella sp.]|nr:hypothetical protein [Daejeonella sp.]